MIIINSILLTIIIISISIIITIIISSIIYNIGEKSFIDFIRKFRDLYKSDIYIFEHKYLFKIKFYKKGKCFHEITYMKDNNKNLYYININISLSLKHNYCPISLLLINLLASKIKEKIKKNDVIKITTKNENMIIKKLERESKLNSIL